MLAALLAGLPAVLIASAGWPLPRAVPTWQQVTDLLTGPGLPDQLLINTLACVGWICWALLTLSAALEIVAAARHISTPHVPALRPAQALVGALVAALALAPLMTRPSDTLAQVRPAVTHSAILSTPAGAEAVDLTGSLILLVGDTTYTYPVRPGDTLWDIADTWLGDPHRWPEIYHLNAGHHFPGNAGTLTDPDLIYPGWHLTLPDDAHPPADTPTTSGSPSTPEPTTPSAPQSPAAPQFPPAPASPPTASGTPPPSIPATAPSNTPAATTTSTAAAIPPAPSSTAPARPVDPAAPAATTKPDGTRDTTSRSSADHETAGRDVGVSLPGGWIGLPFAAALTAAATLAWHRRRRRTRIGPTSLSDPALTDLDPAGHAATDAPDLDTDDIDDPLPLPVSVIAARRQVRRLAPDLLRPAPPDLTVRQAAQARREGQPVPPPPPPGPDGPILAGLPTPLPADGLALTGPGAPDAVRALLVATLTAGGPDDGDAQGRVIIPRDTWQHLLPTPTNTTGATSSPDGERPQAALDPDRLPRLTNTPDLDDALTRIEADLIARRRLLLDADAADVAAYRQDTDHEPIQLTLLITTPPGPEQADRLSAATRLGTTLNVATVLLGPWPPATSLTVSTDGHLPEDPDRTGPGRLAVLDIDTASDLLHGLKGPAEPRSPLRPTPKPHRAPPAEGADAPPTADATATGNSSDTSDASTAQSDSTSTTTVTEPTQPQAQGTPAAGPATPSRPVNGATRPTLSASGPNHSPRIARPSRVTARVLGTPAILMPDGTPVDSVREAALELLTYLAVHRDGANLDDIKEALYGDATRDRARQRLSTDVANLRNRLHHAHPANDPAETKKIGDPVVNTGGRYHLNPDLVDVDWWHVQDAATRARQATAPSERQAALTDALAVYHGCLAEDRDFDWATRARQQTRRTGNWIHAQLAKLLVETDPQGAAALLETACDQDPYDEDLARLALQAHARNGNVTAIKTRMSRLRGALDELDETPAERTEILAKQLTAGATTPRSTRARPEPEDRLGQ